MKQIKYLVALALAAAVTMPAMADPKVTFSGSAQVRYGFQAMKVDKDSMESIAFLAGLEENSTLATQAGFFAYQPAVLAAMESGATGTMVMAGPGGATLAAAGITAAFLDAAYAAVKKSDASEALLTGQKQEQAARLNIKVEDDKLTVKIGAEVDSEKEFELKQAAFSYNYGFGAITYDAAGSQNRWNEDIFYVGGSDENNDGLSSVDFTFVPGDQMGNVFFTFISNKANNAPAKYESNDDRVIPIVQLGYEYTSAMVDARIGGVYDKYKGETEENDYCQFSRS